MAGMQELFNSKLENIRNSKRFNSSYLTKIVYSGLLKKVKFTKYKKIGKKPDDYRTLKRYDVMKVGNVEKIIFPVSKDNPNVRVYVHIEEIFPIIHETHLSIDHGGRNRMIKEIQKNYKNITAEQIMLYLSLCESCQQKSNVPKKKGLVVRPMVFQEMNLRCQTSPESSSQIQTFGNRHYINHENLKESFSDEACSNQDYVLGHSTNDEHAENRDQEFGSSVKVEDESIEFESYETDDSFNSEPNCKLEFKNEETNSSMNIISSSDVECRISTEQSASISTGVLHSSTEQSKFHEAPLSDSTSIFNNSDSDEETDSAFCSYILKEMRCVRNAYKKRMLKMKIISEILNAQQNSS